MTSALTGGCLCGAVRYRAERPPKYVNYCHCTMCQRASGSAFGMFGVVKAEELEFTKGKPKVYRSSDIAERGFCGDCGGTLFFRYIRRPERIGFAIGSLDAPGETPPNNHNGLESMMPWLDIRDDLPRVKTEDDPEFQAVRKETD